MSSPAHIVRVNLAERSYDIAIGRGLIAACGSLLKEWAPAQHAVVITDDRVRALHADAVLSALAGSGIRADLLVVPAGEPSKCLAEAERLWNRLVEQRADRKTVIVAVGGGVVGDLAGFVAATFARGLAFVQVPTSVIAQVDSSVGGKVGINLPLAKNMVGCFWQPSGVVIDTAALDTLPEREYLSGLAEVVKYGVILDAGFFAIVERQVPAVRARKPEVLAQLIERSCQLKAQIVEQDEREETGLRAVLNYGHTFGHAIETVAGYGRYLHGEAVSIGMVCAANLARRLGRIDASLAKRQQDLLSALGLPVQIAGLDPDELLAAMQRDKKAEQGNLKFVLPSRLGHVESVGQIDPSLVRQVLSE
ncbi:MAG TPA: 3-dehydroquinate synthase [Pirellulaceae bacterium]|nr:3-dehydroquinate synthase [Pirellulaceae bacterium]